MSKFIGLAEYHIVDFLVSNAEGIRYGNDEFLKVNPYTLRDRKPKIVSGDFTENSSDCLIGKKMFGHGEDVVLNDLFLLNLRKNSQNPTDR